MATNSCLYDPYVALYIGNYFADTLCLTAKQHTALRLLLLALWTRQTISGFDDENAAQQLCVAIEEWQQLKASVLPLLIAVTPRVFQKIKVMRSYDGQRLPSSEWDIVREVVFERDGHACTYCGSRRDLEGDHILPLCRGGSNCFDNVTTACASCNRSKGQARRRSGAVRWVPGEIKAMSHMCPIASNPTKSFRPLCCSCLAGGLVLELVAEN